jgi:hypothetical protein
MRRKEEGGGERREREREKERGEGTKIVGKSGGRKVGRRKG